MFFYAGMKLNADAADSWLSLKKHNVKQRAWLVKVNRSCSLVIGVSKSRWDRVWQATLDQFCSAKNGKGIDNEPGELNHEH